MHNIEFKADAEQDLEDRSHYYERAGTLRVSKVNKFQALIYYRIHGKTVRVVAIIHGSRHPDSWKRHRR